MKKIINKYRIYALIHGQTLPIGRLFECMIKPMSLRTQKRRKFEPIKSDDFLDAYTEHKSFVSNIPYIDPKILKSEYVVITEAIEETPNAALGCAAKRFEKLCRCLSISNVEDIKRSYGRNRGTFEPYIYQINKLYKMDGNKERDVQYKFSGHRVYLPNRPERNVWKDDGVKDFLQEIYSFFDDILYKSIKYLYDASTGTFENQSPEKISIDHIKSIEIIITSLSHKQTFKKKLEEAASKIGLTDEEVKKISYLWEQRSEYGDLAHAKILDKSEYLPNQYPIPSNVEYMGAFLDSLAPSVILKYFFYIREFYTIDVTTCTIGDKKDNCLEQVYTQGRGGFVHANYYFFTTYEKDKHRIRPILKRVLAKELQINESEVLSIEQLPKVEHASKRFSVRVKQNR